MRQRPNPNLISNTDVRVVVDFACAIRSMMRPVTKVTIGAGVVAARADIEPNRLNERALPCYGRCLHSGDACDAQAFDVAIHKVRIIAEEETLPCSLDAVAGLALKQ